MLFNQAAERIFGRLTNERSSDEWSRTCGLFLPDQQTLFPDQQLPLYRAIQGEFANDVEVFVRRVPTAEGRWVSISGFPIKNQRGDITGGVITCRDVSERKRILQQEQAAREEAERANRVKDEFFGGAITRIAIAPQPHSGLDTLTAKQQTERSPKSRSVENDRAQCQTAIAAHRRPARYLPHHAGKIISDSGPLRFGVCDFCRR